MSEENINPPPAPPEPEKVKKVRGPYKPRSKPLPLTKLQQRVWDMRQEGKSLAETAAALDMAISNVKKTRCVCLRKMGVSSKDAIREGNAAQRITSRIETQRPDYAAAVMDAITEPEALTKLKDAFVACGLPGKVSDALIRRLRTKYFGAVTELRSLKASEIADMFSQKIDLAARYMDDKTAGEASFRELAFAATAMAEKRQLMRGEPTQIVSDLERKRLNELLPALIAEGRRRGITIDGEVVEKLVVEKIVEEIT